MRIENLPLRTCKYHNKNYLFHCWENYSEIIEPSPMVGGHSGGVIGCTFGILEDENGKIICANAWEITFTDKMFKKYCFE